MFKGHNESLHYKMYKSGKSWVFAGIVSVGLLVGFGGVTALADTAPTASDDPTGQVVAEKQPAKDDDSATKEPQADSALPDDSKPEVTTPDGQQPASTPAGSNLENPDDQAPTKDPTNQQEQNLDNADVHTEEPETPVTPTPTKHPSRLAKLAAPAPAPAPAPTATPTAVPEAAPITASDASIDTWMPNKTLQQLVANQLKKSVNDLTKDDVTSLTRLEATHVLHSPNVFVDGTSSFDLKGLELATNLTYLDLSFDPSYDTLSLSEKKRSEWGDVTSLDALSGLTNLQTLLLAHNRITDISPLQNLKHLKVLDVSDNQISDFSMLDASMLTTMSIGSQIATSNTVQFIDPKNPTLTLSQLVKLPQNLDGQLKRPFDVPERYAIFTRDLTKEINGNTSTIKTLFYRSGTDLQGYQVLDDSGTVQFTNIAPQETPYYINSNEWRNIYDYPGSTPIQTPYKYYLRANLQLYYTLTGSTTKQHTSFTVFIPYDNLQTAGDLTVKYLDADGKAIQDDQVISGKLTSDTYDLTAETTSLKGYTFDHADGNLTGPYTTDPQTVSLYFTKDATKPVTPPVVTPTTTVTVTTHYVDQNGQSLHADQVQTGQAGDHYTTDAVDIPGFALTATPANASGTLGSTDVAVTYVYNQLDNPDQPTTPAPITDNSDDDATAGTGTDIMTGQQAAQVTPQADDVANLVSHAGQAATIADLTATGNQPAKVTTTNTATATASSAANTITTKPTAKTTLPQTNDQTRSPLIGLALLLGTLIGFGLKRKQR
ncbi:MucBP domain-containing protein [Levilactobacillus angrenensis]|uniref:MucBP domain-containing protein n=1 Tax=Levilactobacillus angrenensis TaxID=2486020 RepID=A0ABW1U869_9LACO|nr:MucBP domain-containing protein [Levilactobacillus angrenensis]